MDLWKRWGKKRGELKGGGEQKKKVKCLIACLDPARPGKRGATSRKLPAVQAKTKETGKKKKLVSGAKREKSWPQGKPLGKETEKDHLTDLDS